MKITNNSKIMRKVSNVSDGTVFLYNEKCYIKHNGYFCENREKFILCVNLSEGTNTQLQPDTMVEIPRNVELIIS